MSEYEQFQELLDENEVFYKADTLSSGTPLFRIPQKIKNGGFADMLVIFNEDNIKLVVAKIATVDDPEKRIKFYELFNEMNDTYKYFKLYVDSDGDIMLEGDLTMDLRDGDFQPETLMAYIGASLKLIENVYPKIMKLMWAD